MAVWQVDIQKQLGTEYWTNVYHVNVPSQAAAVTEAQTIIYAERQLSMDNVTFVNYRVRPFPAGGTPGTVYPIGQAGLSASADYLPLWNTVNVIFTVGQGRPSRKYLKLPIPEVAQSNGIISSTYLASWGTAYSAALEGMANLCDSQGNPFLDVGILVNVGMRQLRRGSKRKLLPVI
jgi:hypothetical protein